MNITASSNQENKSQENNSQTALVWEAPILYKEEWLNTLGEAGGTPESEGGVS